MIQLGLIGFPLNHSLSPVLHEAALRAAGLPGCYSLYPAAPGNSEALGNLVDRVRSGELTGLNVTIPHKQAVIPWLDALAPTANLIGAVNTVYGRGGKAIGDNTDAPAFLADLDRYVPAPTSAIVLGAGGAARAVVYALRGRRCRICVAARQMEEARQLAARFIGVEAIRLEAESLGRRKADLIVNATSVGMFPHTDDSPWPAGLAFPEGAFVYDLVYNPAETELVRSARAAGRKGTTGLGMLIEQAALAFELWTGRKVERQVMLEAIAQGSH